jgi:L-glyceraldehyde 3-phosphate reductase
MAYSAGEKRYERMAYRSCGDSGLKLPLLSLGLWHNFGTHDDYELTLEADVSFPRSIWCVTHL